MKKLAFLLILSVAFACQRTNEPFTFVHLSDPQLGMGGYEHDVHMLKAAVDTINSMDCDFVLVAGDLVHHAADSAFEDFLQIISALEIPYYLVPGNHDIGGTPTDSSLAYYREQFGDDYYAFSHKGVRFIATNSLLWKSELNGESEKHDEWFEQTLVEGSDDPSVVFGHFPIYIDSLNEEEKYFNFAQERRMALLDQLSNNHVIAYLSGHKHELVINNYEGIQLVTGETTSKNFDKRPMGFRKWEVFPDTLIHSFVAVE